MTSLRLNQKLTNAKGETATVLELDEHRVTLSNAGIRLPDGTVGHGCFEIGGDVFNPANPNAWRVVEEPEVKPKRTLDEILDDAFDIGGRVAHEGQSAYRDEIEALRAELKALVESLIEEAKEEEAQRIEDSQDWLGEDQ